MKFRDYKNEREFLITYLKFIKEELDGLDENFLRLLYTSWGKIWLWLP
jgi:hypothetical protein